MLKKQSKCEHAFMIFKRNFTFWFIIDNRLRVIILCALRCTLTCIQSTFLMIKELFSCTFSQRINFSIFYMERALCLCAG